ncbi:hypothetical protein GALL_356400 [mine drainage metagenome]|uniref:Uncharacterized protein n=1 Tax=mine drainage metagenome TaxID=410659 RepID=A0A1J5QH44_9ZZZZ
MKSYKNLLIGISFLFLFSPLCRAQAIDGIESAVEGKHALDLYRNFIDAPQQIITLSLNIQELFASDGNRYKGLSNRLAQKMHWITNDPLQLKNMQLMAVPSPASNYGYYAIIFNNLDSGQCEALSNNAEINGSFIRVMLNGKIIFDAGKQVTGVATCLSQWPWQDGKNKIEYIGS